MRTSLNCRARVVPLSAVMAATMLFYSSAAAGAGKGSGYDEFRIKREQVFEFAREPKVARMGDRVEIRFETKGFCDATVAIEEAAEKVPGTLTSGYLVPFPRIVRHLASGVLGPNAPEPFQRNSRKQIVIWDSKDDQGIYIDKDKTTVRVSLGLKARFERTLYWHPKKRIGLGRSPLFVPRPEGVYVYEGDGVEQVRLFDHQGNYVRTVYPFPAEKVRQAKGLGWRTWPDGYEAPVHIGFWRSTFLTGGVARTDVGPGDSARAFAVGGGRIALLNHQLSRLATDGSTGGLDLYGPDVSITPPWERRRPRAYRAKSACLSPDGKYLYFTGFYENTEYRAYGAYGANIYWVHGVYRLEFAKNGPPELFIGAVERGKDNAHFFQPSYVTCDPKGRIYVADHYNDRIQVFSPEGRLLKSLPVTAPSVVQVNPKTGAIYVFSWAMPWSRRFQKSNIKPVECRLRRFTSMDDFRLEAEYRLPFDRYRNTTRGGRSDEIQQRAAVDFWTDSPTIWMVLPYPPYSSWSMEDRSIRLFVEHEGKLRETHRFGRDVRKARIRQRPAPLQRQRLYVDPRNGTLYVAEGDCAVSKAVTRTFRIDPGTGRGAELEMPFSFEEMAFDNVGRAYLRTTDIVGRFNADTWTEVPYDYGEERFTKFAYDCRGGHLSGGLVVPSNQPVSWQQSGMGVTPAGDLVISCVNREQPVRLRDGKRAAAGGFRPYIPLMYPGRWRYAEVHVYDAYGKIKFKDAIPGIPDGHGTYIDPKGDIYVLVAGTRYLDGEKFAPLTGTVMKFTPREGRFLSGSGRVKVPLPKPERPTRPADLDRLGPMWARGAKWMYSGIGFCRPGAPCQCWNSRFHIDYFGRIFAPETQRCQVAVLDTNGNLMMHIGRYGNVEDGTPLKAGARLPTRVPTRSIGGDEVALSYACYLATHTDRRLYIADAGNARIVSVTLDYRATEGVALKDVPEVRGTD